MSLFKNRILHNYIIAIGATTFIVHEPELECIPYLKKLIDYNNIKPDTSFDLYGPIYSLAKDKPFIENSITESLVTNCFSNILKCLFNVNSIRVISNTTYYINEEDLVIGEFNIDRIFVKDPIGSIEPKGVCGVEGSSFADDVQREDPSFVDGKQKYRKPLL